MRYVFDTLCYVAYIIYGTHDPERGSIKFVQFMPRASLALLFARRAPVRAIETVRRISKKRVSKERETPREQSSFLPVVPLNILSVTSLDGSILGQGNRYHAHTRARIRKAVDYMGRTP